MPLDFSHENMIDKKEIPMIDFPDIELSSITRCRPDIPLMILTLSLIKWLGNKDVLNFTDEDASRIQRLIFSRSSVFSPRC